MLLSLVGQDAVHFNRAFGDCGLSRDVFRLSCAIEENGLLAIGAGNTDGLFVSSGYFASLDNDANMAFKERYHNHFGQRAPTLNALGQSTYEGVHFMAALARRAADDDAPLLGPLPSPLAFRSVRGIRYLGNDQCSQPAYLAEAGGHSSSGRSRCRARRFSARDFDARAGRPSASLLYFPRKVIRRGSGAAASPRVADGGDPMTLLAWLFGLIVLIVAVAVAVAFLNRFYRKTSRDVALIRTGFGGQQIVLSGGCLALPFLHKVDEINMRTMRIEVSRAGAEVADHRRPDARRRRARVLPARAADGRRRRHRGAGDRLEVAEPRRRAQPARGPLHRRDPGDRRGLTMDSLHDRRAEFVAQRSASRCARTSRSSGLQLESVSLTRMDQAAFAALDDNNAFNAVGLRKLAEIIATSKKKRAEIEADADVSVRQTQLEAIKQRLQPVAPGRGGADRPAPRDREAQGGERRRHGACARAVDRRLRERAHRARAARRGCAEIEKQRELRKLEIEAQLNSEVRKVDSSIALAAKHAEEARAQAQAELARTEIVLAQEQLQTERERAVADRSREIALKREQERGEVETSKAAERDRGAADDGHAPKPRRRRRAPRPSASA